MPERSSPRKIRVLSIVRSVRMRWRLRMFLRGSSIVLGASFLAFLLSAYGLEATRFSPGAVTGLRIAVWSIVLLLTLFFLVRPLVRRITDQQVALYLEEREPSLESAILGAVEVESTDGSSSGETASPALLDRLVERAVDKARTVDYGRRIDRGGLYRSSGALTAITAAVVLFLFFGPSGIRYGMRALVLPTTEAAEVSPYSIFVEPGNVTVAQGSDQLVSAELRGFDSDDVSVFSRFAENDSYQRLSMLPADSGRFDLLLLNLVENTEYFVEANGVRSGSFTIEVAELPYVDEMTHTYVFPAYTGLSPRVIEGGGDIAALAGTTVEVLVQSTMATPRGLLVMDDSLSIELTPMPDGTFTGDIQVREEGVYRIELARSDGQMVAASPDYTVDVLADLAPAVIISDPGRDSQANAIEEVFVEVKADDDYGIETLSLVYSVNGEAEDTLSLYRGGASPLNEVTSGHTLFLEEWELEPGDVISYYAVARDNRNGRAEEALSDIYFINVRPFRRDFRQAEQQQQQQQGGGMGEPAGQDGGSLSELQREVVAASFNLLRDRAGFTADEFRENTVSVALAQGRVRSEVASLLEQMNARGVSQSDPHLQEIAEMLPVAIADMEAAEAFLREQNVRLALGPEQRSLRFLQKAEETYERTVGQQQGGGGGGGGGGGANAEELADLFELELDKLQNQYETVQQGERQQADEQVDELMEKLKELARRQQQELERQRRRAEAQQGGAGGSGGESQRELADEAEETARQLEELSRKTGDPQLAETARDLRQAAQTMRQSAAGAGQDRGLADANSALDDLEEAQRRLQRNQEERIEEGMENALDRVNRLAQSQEEVRREVEQLPDDVSARREGVQRIQEQKDDMVGETRALRDDLVRMQQSARQESREAAAELGEAVKAIQDGKLEEKLLYTKGVVEQREREFALDWEDQISSDIEGLREAVEGALGAFDEAMPDRNLQEALDEARELARGAESLGRRLENRGAANPTEPGQEGQEGQGQQGEGPEGQQGQQGQEGQQGQQGEQGKGQQGQQGQGQQGEQGQKGRGGGQQGDPQEAREGSERVQGSPFGGATRGNPVPFTEEEIRQYTREFAQRLAEARALQERLRGTGREIPELAEAIGALDELRDERVYEDLPQIEALQAQIQENLKRIEFLLRREVEGESAGRAALTGTDEVPAGFRKMVEEYFKNLARGGGGGGGRP